MNWGVEDITAAAALIIGAGLALAVVFRSVHSHRARLLLAGVVAFAVLAIWAHLAVGVF